MVKAAVDWGSSSFRAYLFDDLNVIDSLETGGGIKTAPATDRSNHFKKQLKDTIGHWLKPGDEVLLSGMITSVNGWIETPYLTCPVDCNRITTSLKTISLDHLTLHLVPGICQTTPTCDVMRGEEVQLLGLNNTHDTQLVVMPGTHSKWALLTQDSLQRFRTIITGELFNNLLNNTLVGQLAEPESWCNDTFTQAVTAGFHSQSIVSDLFQCRSSVLLKHLDSKQVAAFLSGLLIGNEIREGTNVSNTDCESVILVGSDTLCSKYQTAMESLNLKVVKATPNGSYPDITAAGFANLIQHHGVIKTKHGKT